MSRAHVTLTAEQVDAIVRKITDGYHERDDYPPYALAVWDDRNRYRSWIITILNEMIQPESERVTP